MLIVTAEERGYINTYKKLIHSTYTTVTGLYSQHGGIPSVLFYNGVLPSHV